MNFPNYYTHNWGLVGQDLALLEVPEYACPGTYELNVYHSPPGGSEVFDYPGSDIQVVSGASGSLNPLAATAGDGLDIDISSDLADLVPNPTVPLRLQDVTLLSTYPAAAEIDITFPSTVTIQGAYEYKVLGVQSSVNWRLVGANTVRMSLVDLQRCTQDLRLVYKLNANAAPVALSQFSTSAATQRLYDMNGATITGNPYVIQPPYDMVKRCGS
jgi:hypothetical protein